MNTPRKPGRTHTAGRYPAPDTYVYVAADYVLEKQLHGYVVRLEDYVRLLIADHGANGQGMH